MRYQSTKTYGHNLGLSCAFRQWRATHSHCRFIHGYAIEIKIIFEASALDANNWVIDFGGLKDLKKEIVETFDHKLIVAEDDPQIDDLKKLHEAGLADVKVLPSVGCEAFSKHVYGMAQDWLKKSGHADRCKVFSVEIREHGANSALYLGD